MNFIFSHSVPVDTAITVAAATNNPFAETILTGSLLLAVPVAILAGLVSFASPCVLPLVPGYLGYVIGLTGVDLEQQKRGRMFAGIGLFVLGFSLVFMAVGALFGQVGAWLQSAEQAWITQVLGLVVVLMGMIFLGKIPVLQRDMKLHARAPTGLWGGGAVARLYLRVGLGALYRPHPLRRTAPRLHRRVWSG